MYILSVTYPLICHYYSHNLSILSMDTFALRNVVTGREPVKNFSLLPLAELMSHLQFSCVISF